MRKYEKPATAAAVTLYSAISCADLSEPDGEKTQDGLTDPDDIPEVVWCRFRYFDGRGWRDAWQAPEQGNLPLAVVCHLILAEHAKSRYYTKKEG